MIPNEGMMSGIQDMIKNIIPKQKKRKEITIKEAKKLLLEQEKEKLIEQEQDNLYKLTCEKAQHYGIVFIDECDALLSSVYVAGMLASVLERIKEIGIRNIVDELNKLADEHGEFYKPDPLLVSMQ